MNTKWDERIREAQRQRAESDAGPARAPEVKRWRTPAQILKDADDHPRAWLVPDLLPFGSVVLLVGLAKRSGKSTWAYSLVAAADRGGAFLGFDLSPTTAVILAEESDPDLADRIRRFGLADSACVVCSRRGVSGVPDLHAMVAEAVQRAKNQGAGILLVDTWAFWAAMSDGAENDAGAVTRALRPLQAAADAGLLVLVVHHVGKAEGRDGGTAARGSTAFAGTVEATLELKSDGGPDSRRRKIRAETRFAGTRDLVIELIERDGELPTYALVGNAAELTEKELEDRVLAFLSGNGRGVWHLASAIDGAVRGRSGDLGKARKRLRVRGAVAWCGSGIKGDPYRYAALGTPAPPAPDSSSEGLDSDSLPRSSQVDPGITNGQASDSIPSSPPFYEGGTGKGKPPSESRCAR